MTAIIEQCVEDIWDHYDKDNSGYLDQEEVFVFVNETVRKFGNTNNQLSYTDFNEIFKEFDQDGSGSVDK